MKQERKKRTDFIKCQAPANLRVFKEEIAKEILKGADFFCLK